MDIDGYSAACAEICKGIDDLARWANGNLPPGMVQQDLHDLATAYLLIAGKVDARATAIRIAANRIPAHAVDTYGLG